MLAVTLCSDSDLADSSVNGHFRSFRTVHSSPTPHERATPVFVRDILGHAMIEVTQNVYGKTWWPRTPFLSDQSLDLRVHRSPAGEIGIDNRDYHHLSQNATVLGWTKKTADAYSGICGTAANNAALGRVLFRLRTCLSQSAHI
jgi:hypothetical protein